MFYLMEENVLEKDTWHFKIILNLVFPSMPVIYLVWCSELTFAAFSRFQFKNRWPVLGKIRGKVFGLRWDCERKGDLVGCILLWKVARV